jgi:hypothetical protein
MNYVGKIEMNEYDEFEQQTKGIRFCFNVHFWGTLNKPEYEPYNKLTKWIKENPNAFKGEATCKFEYGVLKVLIYDANNTLYKDILEALVMVTNAIKTALH